MVAGGKPCEVTTLYLVDRLASIPISPRFTNHKTLDLLAQNNLSPGLHPDLPGPSEFHGDIPEHQRKGLHSSRGGETKVG
jgi:hypothetical protein